MTILGKRGKRRFRVNRLRFLALTLRAREPGSAVGHSRSPLNRFLVILAETLARDKQAISALMAALHASPFAPLSPSSREGIFFVVPLRETADNYFRLAKHTVNRRIKLLSCNRASSVRSTNDSTTCRLLSPAWRCFRRWPNAGRRCASAPPTRRRAGAPLRWMWPDA